MALQVVARPDTVHHGTDYKLQVSTEIPPAPDSLNEFGRSVWAFVWTKAPVKPSDALVVERFCQLHQHRRNLLIVLEDEGLSTTGSQGQTVMHPLFRALMVVEPQIGKLEQVLGLSPEARARLNIADTLDDELDQFMKDEVAE
jgi:P27 family predicted phage terminase small subunit